MNSDNGESATTSHQPPPTNPITAHSISSTTSRQPPPLSPTATHSISPPIQPTISHPETTIAEPVHWNSTTLTGRLCDSCDIRLAPNDMTVDELKRAEGRVPKAAARQPWCDFECSLLKHITTCLWRRKLDREDRSRRFRKVKGKSRVSLDWNWVQTEWLREAAYEVHRNGTHTIYEREWTSLRQKYRKLQS